jgi:hypothetical protein
VNHYKSGSVVLLMYVLSCEIDGTSVSRIVQTVFLNKKLFCSQQRFKTFMVKCIINLTVGEFVHSVLTIFKQ